MINLTLRPINLTLRPINLTLRGKVMFIEFDISSKILEDELKVHDFAEIGSLRIEDLRQIGKRYWFEYHCFESEQSADADIWYHSHQEIEVLGLAQTDVLYTTKRERLENACPLVYNALFGDEFKCDVFEDEILNSKDEFERPDPPNV